MAKGTNTIQKTQDRATRTLLTTEGEHMCSGRGAVPASRVAPVVLLWKRIYLSEKQIKFGQYMIHKLSASASTL